MRESEERATSAERGARDGEKKREMMTSHSFILRRFKDGSMLYYDIII